MTSFAAKQTLLSIFIRMLFTWILVPHMRCWQSRCMKILLAAKCVHHYLTILTALVVMSMFGMRLSLTRFIKRHEQQLSKILKESWEFIINLKTLISTIWFMFLYYSFSDFEMQRSISLEKVSRNKRILTNIMNKIKVTQTNFCSTILVGFWFRNLYKQCSTFDLPQINGTEVVSNARNTALRHNSPE